MTALRSTASACGRGATLRGRPDPVHDTAKHPRRTVMTRFVLLGCSGPLAGQSRDDVPPNTGTCARPRFHSAPRRRFRHSKRNVEVEAVARCGRSDAPSWSVRPTRRWALTQVGGSGRGAVLACPVAWLEERLGSLREVGGWAFVVAAVAHVLAQDAFGLVVQAFGFGDPGEVESGDLLLWCGDQSGFGGDSCLLEVPGVQGVGDDECGRRRRWRGEVVVETVAFVAARSSRRRRSWSKGRPWTRSRAVEQVRRCPRRRGFGRAARRRRKRSASTRRSSTW